MEEIKHKGVSRSVKNYPWWLKFTIIKKKKEYRDLAIIFTGIQNNVCRKVRISFARRVGKVGTI